MYGCQGCSGKWYSRIYQYTGHIIFPFFFENKFSILSGFIDENNKNTAHTALHML